MTNLNENLTVENNLKDAALKKLIVWKLSDQTSTSMAYECFNALKEAWPSVADNRAAMGYDYPIQTLNIVSEDFLDVTLAKIKNLFGSASTLSSQTA